MHIVMFLTASAFLLPKAAEGIASISHSQGFVDSFTISVVFIVPCALGSMLDDRDVVFAVSETYHADW